MSDFELSADIHTLSFLKKADIKMVDQVVLGNPFCLSAEGNLLSSTGELATALELLKAQGKKAGLATPVTPSIREMEHIERLLEAASSMPFDFIEVHDFGVLSLAKKIAPGKAIRAGLFINLYTASTATLLLEHGVSSAFPAVELPLSEIIDITRRVPKLEIVLPVHGYLPLAIARHCHLVEYSKVLTASCPRVCYSKIILDYAGWRVIDAGRAMLGGKPLCMLEHMDLLLSKGFSIFALLCGFETDPDNFLRVSRIYRQALTKILTSTPDKKWTAQALASLSMTDPGFDGFSNGFYFGKRGQDYVSATDRTHELQFM